MNKHLDTRLLAESLDAGIAVTVEGRVTCWSHGAEAIGRGLNTLILPPDQPCGELRRTPKPGAAG